MFIHFDPLFSLPEMYLNYTLLQMCFITKLKMNFSTVYSSRVLQIIWMSITNGLTDQFNEVL